MNTKSITVPFQGIIILMCFTSLSTSGQISQTHSKELPIRLQRELRKAQNQNDPWEVAQAYTVLAKYHRSSGLIDSAVFYGQAARVVYQQMNAPFALAHSLLELKETFSLKGAYLESMNLVYEALDLYESLDDEAGIARCYTHICDLLYYSENLEASVEYANKAIAIQKALDLKYDLAASYFYRACPELFMESGPESSLISINTALALYDELGESGVPYIRAINWRGNVYKYLGRYDDALNDYKSNLVVATKANIKHYEISSYANIGHVYLMKGEYAKALPNNLKAIRIMKETGDTRNLWENCMHVSTAYEKLNQPDSALKYHKAYLKAYEAYLLSVNDRLETEAQVKYETKKKNETISIQAHELEQQGKMENLYLVLAFLLVVVLISILWGDRKRRQRNRALSALNEQLDMKNRQNELLMKEIHHRVKNNLDIVKSLLALQSATMEDPAGREAIIASQNRVRSMGIVHQKLYRGNDLNSIEMKDYFENLAEEILAGYRAEDRVEISCSMDPVELNFDTALPMGLIVNELISNSLKYAFPDGRNGRIELNLNKNADGIFLRVSDNGVGYPGDEEAHGTGFGLQLIDLLTRQLNGVLSRENGNGTTFTFHFRPRTAA